jgi:hypothetical protein
MFNMFMFVQRWHDHEAAQQFLRKLLKAQRVRLPPKRGEARPPPVANTLSLACRAHVDSAYIEQTACLRWHLFLQVVGRQGIPPLQRITVSMMLRLRASQSTAAGGA